ncbi:testis-expressed protein 29 isoform 2-T3 [Anomaloglossus baeobatrachus]|uniref:testis-expressed protein 29 isoform X2 n=1 Tax=Anomaloglossus baeobatrachus TaxID=238106 RepID=UPI003F4F948B
MNKFYLRHLMRRGLFDPLSVCEEPLYNPCITKNKTRLECVLQECCYSMDACYKKKVPDHIKAFYIVIVLVIILLWAILGFWYLKYRRQKKKLDDIVGEEETPAELDTNGMSQKTEELAGTSEAQKLDDLSGNECQ